MPRFTFFFLLAFLYAISYIKLLAAIGVVLLDEELPGVESLLAVLTTVRC